jgi:hypothetical protein
MQEKKDGAFLAIFKDDDGLHPLNRKGEKVQPNWTHNVPKDFMGAFPGHWVVCGELVKEPFGWWIFDVPYTENKGFLRLDFAQRLQAFKILMGSLGSTDEVHVLDPWTKPEDKLAHFVRLANEDAEGAVFTTQSVFLSNSVLQTHDKHKVKFRSTCDAYVVAKRPNGKSAVSLAVLDDLNNERRIGNCGVPEATLQGLRLYDVIEVRYRRLSFDHKLIEPVFSRVRTDKQAFECHEPKPIGGLSLKMAVKPHVSNRVYEILETALRGFGSETEVETETETEVETEVETKTKPTADKGELF